MRVTLLLHCIQTRWKTKRKQMRQEQIPSNRPKTMVITDTSVFLQASAKAVNCYVTSPSYAVSVNFNIHISEPQSSNPIKFCRNNYFGC